MTAVRSDDCRSARCLQAAHSRYGSRRTVRDEGVGTHEQLVRAPIQHSGAMTAVRSDDCRSARCLQAATAITGAAAPYATKESEPTNSSSERQSNTAALRRAVRSDDCRTISGSAQLADGLHSLQPMQTARNLRARRFRRRA
jgi:hypothetical protein